MNRIPRNQTPDHSPQSSVSAPQSLVEAIEQGHEADIPAPDSSEPMVVKSLRMPLRMLEDLEKAAAGRGVGVTVLMRDLIEQGLHEPTGGSYVALDDAIAALSRLARRSPAA